MTSLAPVSVAMVPVNPSMFAMTDTGGYQDIVSALTGSISVSTVSTVLVAAITASIALVFFWWAARKVTQVIFSAFRSGKTHI